AAPGQAVEDCIQTFGKTVEHLSLLTSPRLREEGENTNTPEGASRCRAGASGLTGPVGDDGLSVSCESGRKIGAEAAAVNRGDMAGPPKAAKMYNTNRMSRYYTGPVSDHFDGERFFDPYGVPPKGRHDLLRWLIDRYWRGTKAKWPAWAPSPYAERPPARVDGADWRISYIGHASFLIQTAGLNI